MEDQLIKAELGLDKNRKKTQNPILLTVVDDAVPVEVGAEGTDVDPGEVLAEVGVAHPELAVHLLSNTQL